MGNRMDDLLDQNGEQVIDAFGAVKGQHCYD
jgi:hypothetical protein